MLVNNWIVFHFVDEEHEEIVFHFVDEESIAGGGVFYFLHEFFESLSELEVQILENVELLHHSRDWVCISLLVPPAIDSLSLLCFW